MDGYIVRRATESDFAAVLAIYDGARKFMREHGNPSQWGTSRPTADELECDLAAGRLYVVDDGHCICASFVFYEGEDECYRRIYGGQWLSDAPYAVIHKVASAFGKRGMLRLIVGFALSVCGHIRIDTHRDNAVMRGALEKEGFTPCGTIILDDGSERIAYERV